MIKETTVLLNGYLGEELKVITEEAGESQGLFIVSLHTEAWTHCY